MIAIHDCKQSYSDRWIDYCKVHNLDFIIVSIYDSRIIDVLINSGVKYLLAHLDQNDHRTSLIANEILKAVEQIGITVFPNNESFWHFDDKVKQKYLFESLNLPHSKIDVFFSKQDALDWLSTTKFPFVFKLRSGAGSANVRKIQGRKEAKRYIKKMFGRGIKPIRSFSYDIKRKVRIHQQKRDWLQLISRIPSTLLNIWNGNRMMQREKGYFFAQEFLPNNSFDTRVNIIGDRAFVFRRYNRSNDFRASGSGDYNYSQEGLDLNVIQIAFQSAKKIGSQAMAFDFIYNLNGEPKIIEVSYGTVAETVYNCNGFWDLSLNFHDKPTWPEHAILEYLLKSR